MPWRELPERLDEPRYLQAAIKAADFILRDMRQADGTLLHTWRAGKAKYDAYLDDYASLANALVSLYEATFDERYVDEAVQLVGNYAALDFLTIPAADFSTRPTITNR